MKKIVFLFSLLIIASSMSAQKKYKPVEGLNVGNIAPELNFKSPDGNKISLSDLRGKMVLIDFWASWCGHCRGENPDLVSIYKEYKDKEFNNGDGFTVYSVSLDRNKENWTKAIATDNLIWKNQVSDFKFWKSAAAIKYKIKAIPSSFLINGDGIIVAKDQSGNYLRKTLDKFVKK